MSKNTAACTLLGMFALSAGTLQAGPEKIDFPANYLKGVQYGNVDRHDIKQYREFYTQAASFESVRAGKGVPSGTVLTLVQWSVATDDKGEPLKGMDGRFIKKDIVGMTVMEKRTGWGTEYPVTKRNGEWEYSAFNAKGEFNPKANYNACFECHLPHAKQDFVITLAALSGTTPASMKLAAVAKPVTNEVGIFGFKFNPGKITASVGKAITWRNDDSSPHQVTLVAKNVRSPIALQGQKVSLTLDAPGTYDYICGLHTSMKGQIEVR